MPYCPFDACGVWRDVPPLRSFTGAKRQCAGLAVAGWRLRHLTRSGWLLGALEVPIFRSFWSGCSSCTDTRGLPLSLRSYQFPTCCCPVCPPPHEARGRPSGGRVISRYCRPTRTVFFRVPFTYCCVAAPASLALISVWHIFSDSSRPARLSAGSRFPGDGRVLPIASQGCVRPIPMQCAVRCESFR